MIALLGVVIGGLLTAGMAALLEIIKLRREARAAALLLEDDLSDAYAFLDISSQLGAWVAVPREVLSLDLWKEHRATVARVKFLPWYPTTAAYMTLSQLARLADQHGVENGTPMPEDDTNLGGVVELTTASLRIAVTALREHAQQPSYRESTRRRRGGDTDLESPE